MPNPMHKKQPNKNQAKVPPNSAELLSSNSQASVAFTEVKLKALQRNGKMMLKEKRKMDRREYQLLLIMHGIKMAKIPHPNKMASKTSKMIIFFFDSFIFYLISLF